MKEEIREKLEICNTIKDFKGLSAESVKEILGKDTSEILSHKNAFLGRSGECRFVVFNLPQGISCPEATEICSKGCYQIIPEAMLAAKNHDSAVVLYRKMNLLKSLQDDFVNNMINKINRLRPNHGEKIFIRIHASGDFYSKDYIRKWFEIALRIKESRKEYTFVAYTKSMNKLKAVMENKLELDNIYMRVCNKTREEYKISDFNINIIGSIMDDTNSETKKIIDEFNLPKYIVTNNKKEVTDCAKKACADCKKCYIFPMKDVYTILRKNKKKK